LPNERPFNSGETLMLRDANGRREARWWLPMALYPEEIDYQVQVVERYPPSFNYRSTLGPPHVRQWRHENGRSMPDGHHELTVWQASPDVPWWNNHARFFEKPRTYKGQAGMARWGEKPPTPARGLYVVENDAFDYPVDLPKKGKPAPQRIVEVTRNWDGNGPRTLRILLPRGYDETDRSFPVCYWHDGQNMFADSRPAGHWVETWDLGRIVERLSTDGQITDAIHVGVDNSSRRLVEYLPPGSKLDKLPGEMHDMDGAQGEGDSYLALLKDYVHPYMTSHYRVMDDPQYTGMGGSSMGGLISLYAGWAAPNFARRLAIFSASFWAAEPFVEEIENTPDRKPLLVYLDSGTVGPTHDNIDGVLRVRESLMRKGWMLGWDLRHVVGVGHRHHERAWRQRLADCLRFLYPAGDAWYGEDIASYRRRMHGTHWALPGG